MKVVPQRKMFKKYSVSKVCSYFEISRDAWYKYQNRSKEREVEETIVLELVKEERKDQSRQGTRKLYEYLRPTFIEKNIKIGRDSLFDLLRKHNLLVKRKRSYIKTTDSYHRFHKYRNLIKDLLITHPNQVWVADITYIRTVDSFCYLALITDLYSRKIVGYDLSDSLELAGCRRAFKRARKVARPAPGLIHHSDRGIQYCSNQYVEDLSKWDVQISMTEENHCYENAVAERVNGILKDEFYLDQTFSSKEHAIKATESAIRIYNSKRLHLSLGYKTPDMVFRKQQLN